LKSIDDLVSEALAQNVPHVVLTGGEPMIFEQIEPLAAALHERGMHITIETAGTVFRELKCDLMSISPKLANSTPHNDPRDPQNLWQDRHEQRRLNFAAFQALIDRYPQRQLKFVVSRQSDLQEIGSILTRLNGISSDDVMLMPEGVAIKPPEEYAWIVQACVERGWRLCPRLHIQLFGNKRGT
jgi:7-carboxy-7-deazaguanine synthase